jgi:predicted  nucleic acid-binding Zn-ribbon protein
MLSHDASGLWAYLTGLIVLIMGGVALSLMVDRRLSLSLAKGGLEAEIVNGAADLEFLRDLLADRSRQWQAEGVDATRTADELAVLNARLPNLAARRTSLAGDLADLERTLAALEEEFSAYRGSYRRQVWHSAAGEALGELTLVDGRRYEDAVISRVTAVGLEIRHAHGTARIEASSLSSRWHARFQWDDEERRAKLHDEWLQRERMTAPVSAPPPPAASREADVRAETLAAAAAEVQALTERVVRISAELETARNNARRGGQASVPGSLQTWAARANQLAADLNRANTELNAAEIRLAALRAGR